VLELTSTPQPITGCFGRAAELDRLAAAAEMSVRVAPDELLLVGGQGPSGLPDGGLVVDLSSAYAVWTLSGDDRFEAFRRLSQVELPGSGLLQGLVAHVPMKVVVRESDLLVLVPSVLSHHLQERVHKACADLLASKAAA
jgi:hypothetical protein